MFNIARVDDCKTYLSEHRLAAGDVGDGSVAVGTTTTTTTTTAAADGKGGMAQEISYGQSTMWTVMSSELAGDGDGTAADGVDENCWRTFYGEKKKVYLNKAKTELYKSQT